MSRNTEKAQSMLYRFQAQQAAENGVVDAARTHRPRDIKSVTSIQMCEKWRGQVVQEISRKISRIQDPTVPELLIRDLNDEINKLMKEKYAWEIHLKNLGGPNYLLQSRNSNANGRVYKYFGRARELPDVKEILEAQALKKKERTEERHLNARKHTLRTFNMDYYGFNSDRDPIIQEMEAQERLISAQNGKDIQQQHELNDPSLAARIIPPFDPPTLAQVEAFLLDRKKRELEAKYL